MNKTIVSEDIRKLVFRFSQAINAVVPIARPDEIADAFKRLTIEPTPVEIFGNGPHPPELDELWLNARISRERYFDATAQCVLIKIDNKCSENESA